MNVNENSLIDDLILRCRQKDDNAFAELVQRYMPMMRKVISDFQNCGIDFDVLFSEACVALHSAAQNYRVEQNNVTFGLYARVCVHHRIVDLVRRESKNNVVDYDVEMVSDCDAIEKGLVERETVDYLMVSARTLLSDYEYRVFVLHIQGYKTAEIANMLSKTSKSVDNAKSRLFQRLRLAMDDMSEN